ncbi:MAG: GNAT family N-acetyltransferase [Deltaproteobacteria bacterium CG_4_9_14_0_2_um_filter_42_21]|nr:MAG: GNAT family N-acetyltransferase [Deltaproteobacteria bacterium CG_4_9_14_0_2_um_filter_42_21]
MFQQSITLSGKYIQLLPLSQDHAHDLLIAGRDESLWKYMPIPPLKRVEDVQNMIACALDEKNLRREFAFAIVSKKMGKAIGSTRLYDIREKDKTLEIGWIWIAKDYQRTAVNTETKLLLLKYCFETLGLIRVQFKTDARNLQSQNALERLGAKREGILRKNRICWDGFIRDTVYYSILAEEWPEVRSTLHERVSA